LGSLLQRAGLALPVADNIKLNVSYKSPINLMHDLRGMAETNIISNRTKKIMSKKLLKEVTNQYVNNFSDEDGRIISTFELIFLTGWAPSSTQQKPLAPGSAKVRLAHVLGTIESNPEKD
ncbi:SAM-dependent methyltransferase, partial [Amylibacter sp.]|nr:SAM-dependent methyltransferase [Amylibacter sp.]